MTSVLTEDRTGGDTRRGGVKVRQKRVWCGHSQGGMCQSPGWEHSPAHRSVLHFRPPGPGENVSGVRHWLGVICDSSAKKLIQCQTALFTFEILRGEKDALDTSLNSPCGQSTSTAAGPRYCVSATAPSLSTVPVGTSHHQLSLDSYSGHPQSPAAGPRPWQCSLHAASAGIFRKHR